MARDRNQDKSSDDVEGKLSLIQEQLQKLMEGMVNMNNRNVQSDKELLEIKQAIGGMKMKEKEVEPCREESSLGGDCSRPVNIGKEFHNGASHGNFFTRYSRLEFPRFSGQYLRIWLYKVDHFFTMDEVPYDQRVKVTSVHLDGEAIAWHRSFIKSRNTISDPSWTEYVLALNERFGDGFEDPMEAIKNLQQIGSVRDYQAEFDRLLTGVNLSNENAISYFLGGLKPELNKSIRIQALKSLLQAFKTARLQEEVFEAQAVSWGIKPYTKNQNPIMPNPSIPKYPNF
ncbi:uncharacterized protein LOC132037029 [Lycium ferocissimum]|uniref:uncharacterized protein LOC132037029 n=1 Tax=Lycium ferocissimum TaxID=112874 RepID=UPI002815E86B|nr:uncharacterized protein LOC132037029 [Lycium ferocissimum]